MLIMNTPMLDWVTLTTYSRDVMNIWKMNLLGLAGGGGVWIERKRHLQYDGFSITLDAGTAYVGWGEQRVGTGGAMRKHAILTLSGALSHEIIEWDEVRSRGGLMRTLYPLEHQEAINCTRLDLQITCLNKESLIAGSSHFYMGTVFDEIKKSGKTVSWMESKGTYGQLATVGINARIGDVYHRVYAKPTERGDAVRFETEYKNDTAKRVWAAVIEDVKNLGGLVRRQIERAGVSSFGYMFEPVYFYKSAKIPPSLRDGIKNTEVWLLAVVLPSLERVLMESEQRELVAAAFLGALENYVDIADFGGVIPVEL